MCEPGCTTRKDHVCVSFGSIIGWSDELARATGQRQGARRVRLRVLCHTCRTSHRYQWCGAPATGVAIHCGVMTRVTLLASVALPTLGWPAVAQSPRAANPERPTVATHAYAVAPGYVEVEQGISARGSTSLAAATSWDLNVKIGIASHIQLGLFGPGYLRIGARHGI